MNWTHGTSGLLIPYGLCAVGVLIGSIWGSAPLRRTLFFPWRAIFIYFIAIIFWHVLTFWVPSTLLDSSAMFRLFLAAYFLCAGIFAGKLYAHRASDTNHLRGSLVDPFIRRVRRQSPDDRMFLTLAGLPIHPLDETKHFKLIGTTGTGKSTAIRELLGPALERGDRAVIADPDGSYLTRFYNTRRGDVILNPFNERAARWDLFAEMATLYDADQLARSLIADAEGSEGPWRNYARVFLASVLRQLHRVKHHDVGELYQLLSLTPVDDLRELLADTPAASYLSQDNGRFFGAVRAVANTHLGALEHIARQTATQDLSVRNWIKRGRGTQGVLFLPYHANEIAGLRSVISTWMRLAIFEAMSQPEGDQRLWFVVDELDALGQIDGLKDALARLRKFGGRCVLGLQSIAQVSGTYGHAEAQTIVENCGNTLILRCSASEGGGTARFASQLIGEREVLRKQVTETSAGGWFSNNRDSRSTSVQPVMETSVLPSEIEQLPDLQGYLKFASTPGWRSVQIPLQVRN
jgi:type IV secretory pathway TraG/TraD family ATPase VirD4